MRYLLLIHSDEEAWGAWRGPVVRIWPLVKELRHATTPVGRVHEREALRQRSRGRCLAQRKRLSPLQDKLDGPSKPGPVLDLRCDRATRDLPDHARVENEIVGELHRLTHG